MNKKKATQPVTNKGTNAWDFGINLLNKGYLLCKMGKIIEVILLLIAGVVFVVAVRIPSDKIAPLIFGTGMFLRSERFYFLPLMLALIISVSANIYQKKKYTAEIKRISSIRSEIIHGTKIEKHSTSAITTEGHNDTV